MKNRQVVLATFLVTLTISFAMGGIFNDIKRGLEQAGNTVVDAGRTVVDKTVDVVGTGIDKTKDLGKTIGDSVVTGFDRTKDVVQTGVDKTKDFGETVGQGIKTGFDKTKDAVGTGIDGAKNLGNTISNGANTGLDKTVGPGVKATETVAQIAARKFIEAKNRAEEEAKKTAEKMKTAGRIIGGLFTNWIG